MLTDKEAEALERLEAEREKRIAAKVEAGEAIRVPLSITHNQDADATRARALAELRAAGEQREIIFDELVINTGVPRGTPFGRCHREARQLMERAKPAQVFHAGR